MQSPIHCSRYDIDQIVFIDDGETSNPLEANVISTIRDYHPEDDDRVLCAVGSPTPREKIVEILDRKNVVFHTFIDDRAAIGDNTQISSGSIICPGTVISAGAQIDKHVHINFNCSVGHDTTLGSFTTLSPSVNIMGEVRVGASSFFGGSAVVLPRLEVGEKVVVGAGSVVTKSVSNKQILVGNPARSAKARNAEGR